MEIIWEMRPFFRVFGFSIRYYSLIFIAVFLGGWAIFRWQLVRAGAREHTADYYLPISAIGIWVGGRLFHYLFYASDEFFADPMVFFDVSRGGIASHGSVLGMLLGMWVLTRWRGASFIEGCDRFAITAAYGAAMVRLGNLFNSEIVGRLTDQSWGFRFVRYDPGLGADVPLRHPSQLYEFAMGIAVMLLLIAIDRWAGREHRPRGLMISSCFVLYFGGRFLVEFFKEYQAFDPSIPLTMGQVMSIPGVVVGILGLVLTFRYRIPASWPAHSSKAEMEG